jgi:MscS family membrane protein
MTRIRTFSKNPIYIPNSIFASIPIETPSRMTNRRINEVVGIRYDDIAKIPHPKVRIYSFFIVITFEYARSE